MLVYLRITNFALLDDVEIVLLPGMTVLTGETGAGKSLLINAVSLLRGGRASADMIREGADEARVEAVFEPPPGSLAERALSERLAVIGIDSAQLTEDGLTVRRVIGRGGKSRVYLAGQLSTVTALTEICGGLIEIAGQHEHQTLMDTGRHLGILDESGVPTEALSRMSAAHDQLRQAGESLRAASLDERTRVEREEFLRFQIHEIDQARPTPGEDEELRRDKERLRAAERLYRAARRSEEVLYSREGAVLEELGRIVGELSELSELDANLLPHFTQIAEAQGLLEDAANGLRRYADGVTADPDRLQEIDDRLHLLSRLLRKHGPDLTNVLRKRDEMESELRMLVLHEERRSQAVERVAVARLQAGAAAEALTSARKKVALHLSAEASRALKDLSMMAARLEVRIDDRLGREGDDPTMIFETPAGRRRRLSRGGWDRCELMLASNHGEEVRPLSRIASGGELSRVMLALKTILGRSDGVATYVFDEIDAGIGGAVADRVGRQIHALSQTKQVLCITHLAQIAAFGDKHFLVEKTVESGRTHTLVRALSVEERREEVARMLGGARVTQRTRAHAEEMLRDAK